MTNFRIDGKELKKLLNFFNGEIVVEDHFYNGEHHAKLHFEASREDALDKIAFLSESMVDYQAYQAWKEENPSSSVEDWRDYNQNFDYNPIDYYSLIMGEKVVSDQPENFMIDLGKCVYHVTLAKKFQALL